MNLATLSNGKKLFLGAAVLLLIDSFLPWYHASIGPISVSLSGWHQLGTVAWVLLIAVLIWEAVRLAGAAPVDERRAELYSSVGALAVVVFAVIFVLQRLTDGSLGIGFWLGVILLIAFGYATWTAFRASGGADAVRKEMDDRRRPPAV